ncbi:PspC domain-containing protein [Gordonia sp. TBRC 11910]|uniref:PspC domain-containing protein n=1 Tax=Gordonia asplenii TaxID=2725283 RepID=A0A848KQN0_9ACTN|nr:PspC domain-containing protein [Gordonia asplenii]
MPVQPPPPKVHRRDGGRVVAGVAGGIADYFDVDAFRVRVVFVVLAALAGAGVIAYAALWFFCPQGDDTTPPSHRERQQAYGLAVLGLVAAFLVGFVASGTPAAQLVPLVVVAIGASLVWREFDKSRSTPRSPLLTWTRLIGGAVLVIGGLAVVVWAGDTSFGGLNTTLVAVLATLIGVVLLTVPLWMRLWRALNEERAAAIRIAEREEIASHLHDSVLQTLALIQKRSDRPDEVARLARRQERELRGWLFGDTRGRGDSLSGALKSVAAEVEDTYDVDVEVVSVGDLDPSGDRRWDALVAASREALVNAAKHSGQRKVDMYCEIEDHQVEVFVRDRGSGFDVDAVADDRQGIAGSIRGRIDRAGGTVSITSSPDRGTNVGLRMPRCADGDRAEKNGGRHGTEKNPDKSPDQLKSTERG